MSLCIGYYKLIKLFHLRQTRMPLSILDKMAAWRPALFSAASLTKKSIRENDFLFQGILNAYVLSTLPLKGSKHLSRILGEIAEFIFFKTKNYVFVDIH